MPKRSAGVGALVASLFALVISLVKLIVIAAAAIVATSWQLVAAIVNAASGKARRTVAAGGGGTPNHSRPTPQLEWTRVFARFVANPYRVALASGSFAAWMANLASSVPAVGTRGTCTRITAKLQSSWTE
jgi:hypothetical protein